MEAKKMDAMTALRLVVEEAGADYIYIKPGDDYVYQSEGEASCIVGRVLVKMGADMEMLIQMDACYSSDLEGLVSTANHVINGESEEMYNSEDVIDDGFSQWLVDSLSVAESQALNAAQVRQDQGHTFGAALVKAEIEFSRHGG